MKKKRLGDSKVNVLAQERALFKKLVVDHKIQIHETTQYIRFVNPTNHRNIIFVLPQGQNFKYKIAKIYQIL